jgi:uncharacterized membrane protein
MHRAVSVQFFLIYLRILEHYHWVYRRLKSGQGGLKISATALNSVSSTFGTAVGNFYNCYLTTRVLEGSLLIGSTSVSGHLSTVWSSCKINVLAATKHAEMTDMCSESTSRKRGQRSLQDNLCFQSSAITTLFL